MTLTTLTPRQALGLLAGAAAPGYLFAQGDRPVPIILPVSAGSGVDAITRAASVQLGKALGTTVVVDNQPGAGGVVGTANLVKSAPDGHTLGMVSNNHVIYPSVIKSLPFDPIADITPVSVVCATPMVLVVHPSVPANNLREFTALLKAHPGKYNFASSGNGTILHLGAELFKDATGTFSTHIPYRGTGQMVQDLIGGQVDWGVVALPAILGAVRAGQVRALCVPSAQRSAAAPEIPTAAEQGLPQYQVEGWVAAVGPKGLPADVVKRVHAAFTTAYSTPEVREAMARQGNNLILGTPEAAAAHFRSELARYAAVVVKRGGVGAQ